MNLQIKVLVLFLFLGLSLQAQKKIYYTYVSDRTFTEPHELYGYTLVPNEWEDANGRRGKLSPGEVTFSVVRGYLRVTGGKAEGLYGVNRIEREGNRIIRVSLLDAKDPANQGSLKVILDDNKNIDAYIFRRSRNSDEIIYYQKGLSTQQKARDKKFFTSENQLILAEDADLWGNTIRPFFVLTRSSCNRIYPEDSVSFKFIEEIDIKTKPEKESREKAKISLAKPAKKDKKKEEVVVEDEFENESEMESEEREEEDFGFFKVVDEEEKALEKELEEETATEEIIEEDVAEEKPAKTPKTPKEKVSKEKAPKEKRSYKVIYKYNEWVGDDEDGFMDEKKEELVIKKWKRLTSRYDGDKNTRYVLEITTSKGDIFLYMNERNAISMLEIDGNRYLMRGY